MGRFIQSFGAVRSSGGAPIALALIALLICAVTLISVSGAASQSSAARKLTRNTQLVREALEVKFRGADFNGWQTAYAFDVVRGVSGATSDSVGSRRAFLASSASFRRELGTLSRDSLNAAERAKAKTTSSAFEAFMKTDTSVIALYRKGTPQGIKEANGLVLGLEIRLFERISTNTEALVMLVRTSAASASSAASSAAASAKTEAIAAGIIALGASMVVLLAFVRALDRVKRAEVLVAANAVLEQRVEERTDELRASNNELEAFVYSVSHDLRSPLRSMDGFSHLLLEDYSTRLDEQGRHYLVRIREGAQRMGRMIDELLTMSRISRSVVRREQVDLSSLARRIAGELQRSEPARGVEFRVADGLTANGDPELIRIALENLLSNAWKFTSQHEQARIEFGATEHDGHREFFVRDDGAGFDMEHAKQLFRPFQRLHRTEEFSGTGIGLASVKRIVARHGGQIDGEGQVEQGATFTFTLEPNGAPR